MSQLFHTHERLNRDTRTAWMLRTLAASLAAHAVFLAAVVYVPAVRDTFSLASTLSGLSFVEEDYTKTDVGRRADVMLNFADNKLYYPPGYFSPTDIPSPDAPQFVEEVRPQPVPTPKPVRIKPTPTPTPEASPSPDAAAAGDETTAKNEGDKTGTPGASPTATPQSPEEAERLAKQAGVDKFPPINVKPFTDLLKKGREMKEAREIDLTGTLEMEFEGDRKEDGTLANVKIKSISNPNPKLEQLASEFIAAIGSSKMLKTLSGANHLEMKVKLDDKEIAVRILTEMSSTTEAADKSNAYNLLLWGAQLKKGDDHADIFKSIKVASEAKQIVLNFQMPRKTAGDLLSKLIKKQEEVKTAATPPPS